MSKTLFEAIIKGDMAKVKECFEKESTPLSIESISDLGSLPVQYKDYPVASIAVILAAQHGFKEIVEYLFNKAMENPKESSNEDILFALSRAVSKGDVDTVKILLPFYNNRDLLLDALPSATKLEDKNKTILKLILTKKNIIGPKEVEQLIFDVLRQPGDPESFKVLLDFANEINVFNESNDVLDFVLDEVYQVGNQQFLDIIKEKLSQKFPEKISQSKPRGSALINALRQKKPKWVHFLIDNDVNVDVRDLAGLSAFQIAYELGDQEIVEKITRKLVETNKREIVKPLEEMLILKAVTKNNTKFAHFLIDHGANMRAIFAGGDNLLEVAFETGDKELVAKIKRKYVQFWNNEIDIEPDPFLRNFRLVKDAGHVLGLSKGNIAIKLPHMDSFQTTPYEGASRYRSMNVLLDFLQDYLNKNKESISSETQKYYQEISESISRMMELDPYDAHKINLVPSGWSEHVITLAFYKGELVVANRGGGKKAHDTGLNIYALSDKTKSRIGNELLTDLSNFNEKDSPKYSETVILKKIDDLILEYQEKIPLRSKDQKHGTCSFVNLKAAIQAILCVRKKEDLLKQKGEVSKDEKEIIEHEATRYARKEYKKFTSFIRGRFLDKLIEKVNFNDPRNPEQKTISQKILIDYIKQHHGMDVRSIEKRATELSRVYKILSSLNSTEIRALIEANKKLMPNGFSEVELLSAAVKFGDVALVERLLEIGFDINEKNKQGMTALMEATQQNRQDMVSLLLSRGAKVSDKNEKTGDTITKSLTPAYSVMQTSKKQQIEDKVRKEAHEQIPGESSSTKPTRTDLK